MFDIKSKTKRQFEDKQPVKLLRIGISVDASACFGCNLLNL